MWAIAYGMRPNVDDNHKAHNESCRTAYHNATNPMSGLGRWNETDVYKDLNEVEVKKGRR